MAASAAKVYDSVTALVGGLINIFSPKRAGLYVLGRQAYSRAFVAGETKDADAKFRPRRRSGDAAVKRAYRLAVDRCRDQAENNPLISGGIDRVCNNVVRSGIMPKFRFRKPDGTMDTVANKAWRMAFLRWARYADINGHDSYGADQRLGLRHMWSDGGFLVHRTYDTAIRNVVPLRLELLELDQLDTSVDGQLANGNIARRGRELHPLTGAPVAYHVLRQHPGDYLHLADGQSTERINASEIFEVWDRRRISQYSSVPWLVAVVMEAFRMEDFRHITQDAARLQSSFVAFLESAYPEFRLGGGIGLGGQTSLPKPGETGATEAPRDIQGNIIQPVPPGTRVNMNAPTQPGPLYEPFIKDSQRTQSAGMGMSFEAYANNYTDASYASSRSGSLEERLSYRAQQQFLEEKFNRRIMAWFMEAAWLAGLNPVAMPGYADDPHYYHELAEGQFPGWGWVDPSNDANAAEKKIDLTIDTHHNLSAQAGLDWDENIDELTEEEKKKLELARIRAERLQLENGNANATAQ